MKINKRIKNKYFNYQIYLITILLFFSFTLSIKVKFKSKADSEGLMEMISSLFSQIDNNSPEGKENNENSLNNTSTDLTKNSTDELLAERLKNISPISHTEEVVIGVSSVDKEKIKILYQGWLKISSTKYKEESEFPPIYLPGGKELTFKTDKNGYLKNPSINLADPDIELPSTSFFYFRLSHLNLYYSISKKELNILNALSTSAIISIEPFNDYEDEGTCFQLKDKEQKNWKLCARNIKEKNNWICTLSKIIGVDSDRCYKFEKKYNIIEVETKVEKPMIVVPYPSKQCNEKWDYSKQGKDWECECSEGNEQSPVDLPLQQDSIETTIRPIFQFNYIQANSTQTTLDKMLIEGEYIKIRYKENMLRILHPNLGRAITFDGTIFQAEEIQFHTPSEHTVNGKRYDMEMQVIHYGITKGDIGKQLVLCFLFESKAGKYNQFINDIDFFNLPDINNPEADITNDLFIPKVFYTSDEISNSGNIKYNKPFSLYTYQGSLTSPPCAENTLVVVSSEIMTTSVSALNMFKEAIGRKEYSDGKGNFFISKGSIANYRETQNLNGRPVFFFDCEKHCPQEQQQTPQEKAEGHYEKIIKKSSQYFYVENEKPSGVPDSFVVGQDEIQSLGVE